MYYLQNRYYINKTNLYVSENNTSYIHEYSLNGNNKTTAYEHTL